MAQVGGILARLSVSGALEKEGAIFFMALDKVKFRKPVLPGDQIIFELVPLRTGSKVWKMAGKAFVNDKLVTEAELLATIA
jgi:3-hydroxymyristoyl/3-hydroxydecanoyl-(acyl carrier protein) dehydratase